MRHIEVWLAYKPYNIHQILGHMPPLTMQLDD